jgi:hypothetical protein
MYEPAHPSRERRRFVNALNSWTVQLVQWSKLPNLMTSGHFTTQTTERTSHVEIEARVDRQYLHPPRVVGYCNCSVINRDYGSLFSSTLCD